MPVLFLVVCYASADVSILGPVAGAVRAGGTIELGQVMPGETLIIVIDRDNGFNSWDNAEIDASLLPEKWEVMPVQREEKSLSLRVGIPPTARLGSQNLAITALDEGTGVEEEFNAVLFVRDDLISVQMHKTQARVRVNGTACYKVTLINGSSGSHSVTVSSSLPTYWFSSESVELRPKDSRDLNLWVNALYDGSRDFYFHADSGLFDRRFHSVRASIDVEPTARGKYSSALSGFPFFTPTLVPFYLIDSFLSLLS